MTTTWRTAKAAHQAVELLADGAQMLFRELADVALEARLRPAALIVTARLLVVQVGELLEATAPQPVERTSSRPTTTTSAPPRDRPAARAERGRAPSDAHSSGTDSVSGSGRQTLSIVAVKTASPWAPSRLNSFAK